ncbi:MAG: hypothetical protein KKA73_09705 [Chloroflexi bacterium]|nr:hypothetical protein [Chloroflexota bacterium]MBU1747952.1 hypothetical protein [Chloroflexota bacterium]MBU1878820.1 hypothetical protein [Chloroflexota bacterium]
MIDPDKFLNPDVIKSNLILSSLYLAAYELLKDAIVDNIRDFFSFEYKNGRAIPDEQYKDEVVRVHKDLLYASCSWLQRNGVITENEVEEIETIRKHRNQVAHELPKLLGDADLNLNVGYFLRIRELLEKIEVWWIKNVEIPVNTDFDGVDVNEEDIRPGRVIALDYVISASRMRCAHRSETAGTARPTR